MALSEKLENTMLNIAMSILEKHSWVMMIFVVSVNLGLTTYGITAITDAQTKGVSLENIQYISIFFVILISTNFLAGIYYVYNNRTQRYR